MRPVPTFLPAGVAAEIAPVFVVRTSEAQNVHRATATATKALRGQLEGRYADSHRGRPCDPPWSWLGTEDEGSINTEELAQSGFRYAYSLTHHAHDAQDLVQAAWLKLQRAYSRVENKMLLFTAIRNLFYDGKRREKIVRFEGEPEIEDRPDVPQESGMRGMSMFC